MGINDGPPPYDEGGESGGAHDLSARAKKAIVDQAIKDGKARAAERAANYKGPERRSKPRNGDSSDSGASGPCR